MSLNPEVQAYGLTEDVKLGSSIVEANPQLGKRGATQYFIEDINHELKSVGDPIELERRDLTLKGCN